MMTTATLNSLDVTTWARRQHFEHYLHRVPCTYSLTVELDTSRLADALRTSTRKTYIAQIWAIASVVNRHREFRMALTDAGDPAVWSITHPSFTVFNSELETFASVWVPYDPDFGTFHDAAAQVHAEHAWATEFFPLGTPPANSFDVSSLPWTSFTGFTLNIDGGGRHLAPIFTLGRYVERDGRTLLPVALQIHHAAADGFHASRLLNELGALLNDPSWL